MRSFEDLNNPEIAAMFDTDRDDVSGCWAGDVAWASAKRWPIKFMSIPSDQLLPASARISSKAPFVRLGILTSRNSSGVSAAPT